MGYLYLYLLPQTDRATRCVSRSRVNCCTTVGTSCAADDTRQIHTDRNNGVTALRSTMCVQPRRVARQQAQSSTSFVDNTIVICLERRADLHTAQLMPLPLIVSFCFNKIQIGFTFLPCRDFQNTEFGTVFQREVPLFWRYPNSL